MLTYFLFIIGFFILIKGADLLIEGSSSIAKRLKIPSIVIGLTIVAFGTSAPEFVVSLLASVDGHADLAIGNILGSNIANILLILGVAAIIFPLTVKKNTALKEIPLSLLAIVVLGLMVNDRTGFYGLSQIDGLVLLTFFVVFLYYTFSVSKNTKDVPIEDIKKLGTKKSILFILLGLLGLTLGGKWIVDGAIKIAEIFKISESIIGLTIVAIGTSLPELATSVIAAYKKQTDIAIGNVVGSNIFNIFWILGFSAVIHPIPFNNQANPDILMAIIASVILFLTMFVGKKRTIERWQGIAMVLLYIGYIGFLVTTK